MNVLNNDITLGTAYIAPVVTEEAGESHAVTRQQTHHEAGVSTSSVSINHAKPELVKPSQELNSSLMAKGESELDGTLAILLALLEMARRAREMGVVQRDIENKSLIAAQKDQVTEMRDGAKLMMVMAIVSGVMTGLSALMGGFSVGKGAKGLKQEKALNVDIANQSKDLDGLKALKGDNPLGAAGQDLSKNLDLNKAKLARLDHKFNFNNTLGQTGNSLAQGTGQIANQTIQFEQGKSQADVKEDEVRASIVQTEKEKTQDHLTFQYNFMKDVLQIMQQYTQSHNQAMRAAFGVA
ncbi:YopD family type III secretion system translocon subunit [Aeromonas veronii]|uniref:YopD family type III secretion system translocon subunit n=1 Tax=Aeromonas veronii TaxID=654 RepID=UPI001077B5CB|nr:YopD family type III secretion system translocon subunit [Aeromonas veronii]EKP0302501.1 YopD family type III secretion system translocon subunit [Aeromonas veronii]MBA2080355.1 hypothetical protein [Aeromonas veronii]MCF5841317.1 YopD family type III secretion system translocon subunit [Aeromonas veronii]MCF5886335.1 YopD family type III secretion system translocon subunit [Aeromonas veronii]TNI70764.1 AopD protein [Aeromonas veronii]